MEFKKKQIEARACIELYSNGERCVVKPLESFGKIPITMTLIDVTPPRGGLKALIKEKEIWSNKLLERSYTKFLLSTTFKKS